MSHESYSENEAKERLSALGLERYEDLIVDGPFGACDSESSESSTSRSSLRARAATASDEDAPVYLGAGFYDHSVSSSVDQFVSQVEFHRLNASPGRPFCRELAGALASFHLIASRLTGYESTLASVYRRGSALTHACLCATEYFADVEPDRRLILVPETLSPTELSRLRACSESGLFEILTIPSCGGLTDLSAFHDALDAHGVRVAGTVVPYPNFYGLLDRVGQLCAQTREVGGFAIMSADPLALAALRSPAEWGADLTACDAHLTPAYPEDGDARLGFVAASQRFLSTAPATVSTTYEDDEGEVSFRLSRDLLRRRGTPRTSSSASASAASGRLRGALRTLGVLAFTAPRELRAFAKESRRVAQYAHEAFEEAGFEFPHTGPFLREFAVRVADPDGLTAYLDRWGVVGGYRLPEGLLLAFTEKRRVEEVDELVYFMKAYRDGAR